MKIHLSDQLETDYGTAILEELTGQSLTRKGQPVRLFDQSTKTAEAYFPADEQGKPYVQNFQESKRWYPITAWAQAHELDWKTALHELADRYLDQTSWTNRRRGKPQVRTAITATPKPPVSYHEPGVVEQTLERYEANYFAQWLVRLVGRPVAYELLEQFRVGTWLADYGVSSHWKHCTVYWQIDEQQRVHAGKILYYPAYTGRRMRERKSNLSTPSWAHNILSLTGFNYEQCLFGLHQLAEQPTSKPIAIVESEKSALIATAFEPGFIWLATGGLGNLQADKFKPLAGRNIVLFPDLGGYRQWNQKAEALRRTGLTVRVSSLLENRANVLDRQAGLDLADYLTRYRCPTTGRALNEDEGYPALWDTPNAPDAVPTLKQIFLNQP